MEASITMTQLFLARHGETEWNVAGRIQGQQNSNLSARGRAQAHRLSERLASVPLQAIYASDLARAMETAQIVAAPHGLPVRPLPGLRERGYGAWEGLTPGQVEAADYEHWYRYYVTREFDAPVPGGENWAQVRVRMGAARDQARADFPGLGDKVLLVGHGASLRTLITDALDAPLPMLRHFHLENTSLSRLDYRPDHPARVVLVNDTSHLDAKTALETSHLEPGQ